MTLNLADFPDDDEDDRFESAAGMELNVRKLARQAGPAWETLSPQEFSVMIDLACGLDGHKTAEKRGRTYSSVKSSRRDAYRKLGVNGSEEVLADLLRLALDKP